MKSLLIPIIGLAVAVGALIVSAQSSSGGATLSGRPIATVFGALVGLALLVVIVSIWSQPNVTRLKTLTESHPDADFANVMVDGGSVELLAGSEGVLVENRGESRLTLGMTFDSLQLWRGGREPELFVSRKWSTIDFTSIEVIPSGGREAPSVAIHLRTGEPIYLEPFGFVGGVIRATNGSARELHDQLLEHSQRVH